jgi:hypothetical protein
MDESPLLLSRYDAAELQPSALTSITPVQQEALACGLATSAKAAISKTSPAVAVAALASVAVEEIRSAA